MRNGAYRPQVNNSFYPRVHRIHVVHICVCTKTKAISNSARSVEIAISLHDDEDGDTTEKTVHTKRRTQCDRFARVK